MIEGIIIGVLAFGVSMNAIAIRMLVKRIVYLEMSQRDIIGHIKVIYDEMYRKEK